MIDTILKPIKFLFKFGIFAEKENIENKILSVEDIYTPLSVAKEEIWRRWNDKELRKKVEDFLGGEVVAVFKGIPRAVLARHITSPNFEFLFFIDVIKHLKLEPLFIEYRKDLFSSKNKEKYHLCKLHFEDGLSENWIQRIKAVKITDFNLWEGKKLNDIEIKNGKNIIEMHRILLSNVAPNFVGNIWDISEWSEQEGKNVKMFYRKYLALFLCYGILFENFSTRDTAAEKDFVRDTVMPAITEIENVFGIKPIIVPLLPIENEENLHWWCYPYKLKNVLVDFLK